MHLCSHLLPRQSPSSLLGNRTHPMVNAGQALDLKGIHHGIHVNHPWPDSPNRGYADNRPTTGDIQTIHGGFGLGGCSSSSQIRHTREARGRASEEVYNVSIPKSETLPSITFTNEDLRGSTHFTPLWSDLKEDQYCPWVDQAALVFGDETPPDYSLVLQILSGEQMEYAIYIGFKATNNEVEYEAFLFGLRVAIELEIESLDIYNDSQLVVNQVQGDYLSKDLRMMVYLDKVKVMSMKIKDFKICQIPKEENKQVDALANLASAFDFISDRSVPLEFLPNPSIDVAKTILQTTIDPPWMDGIITYLKDKELPSDKLQTR
ncbi:hypothetical protein Acr_24g0009340 [Actinidia rufa]|uniref:RNase H type-1 domain-containing protein n=1 Tax=Actinidia rufa TaxID=165716 RepID=A0A7J0GW50_9ERIC|nr:hypothetical protein Acr_24g0009340 [Actinidia rufa]